MDSLERELLRGARLATNNPKLRWADVFAWFNDRDAAERHREEGEVLVHSAFTGVWYVVSEKMVKKSSEEG